MGAGCTYSVLVTGITGSGKSSLCNFFCQSKTAFLSNSGFASVTSKAGAAVASINGQKVKLIDTPGFCDDYETEQEHMMEIGEAIYLARDGVNAICLAINADARYTKSESNTIKDLLELKAIWPFTFVAFTNAGALGETEELKQQQLKENLKEERCPKLLLDLLKSINYRYLLVESINVTGDPETYYACKTTELLQMINLIHQSNNRKLYTNEIFIKAKETVDRVQRECQSLPLKQAGLQKNAITNYERLDENIKVKDLKKEKEMNKGQFTVLNTEASSSTQTDQRLCEDVQVKALKALQEELNNLQLQVKELNRKRNKHWYSYLSKTGKECLIQ